MSLLQGGQPLQGGGPVEEGEPEKGGKDRKGVYWNMWFGLGLMAHPPLGREALK